LWNPNVIYFVDKHTAQAMLSQFTSVEKLGSRELLGINQILSQLMEARCETLHSEIHNLMDSVWCKKELP
jgi:hypothetical protein